MNPINQTSGAEQASSAPKRASEPEWIVPADSARQHVSSQELYLNLMKKCLTRLLFPEPFQQISPPTSKLNRVAWRYTQRLMSRFNLNLVRLRTADPAMRHEGLDWPASAETMIGLKRLDNLHHCLLDVLEKGVPGDVMEAGVWRGGAGIFMRAVLKAYGVEDRHVWLADSFRGLPKPNAAAYPADAGNTLWQIASLAVPLEEVQENFRRYGLLDDQVHFLLGWFRDTLPTAPVERLALLRLDGDLYESTMDSLTHLYPKVSPGGYVIIDDYALPNCRMAVEDFRSKNFITDPMLLIDQYAQFWQRT